MYKTNTLTDWDRHDCRETQTTLSVVTKVQQPLIHSEESGTITE